jgi:ribonuclease Z
MNEQILLKGCDLIIHEATMENSLHENAVKFGHSTPEMTAEFAANVGAKVLTITHVSPRYKPMSSLSGI